MESEIYTVKTSGFEGPFALLLDLIDKRKLFINDVSLAQVTEDYIKYIGELNQSHPSQISSFVLVAATLILVKSKSLLPDLNLTGEEEGDIKSLEERLRLYELFIKLGSNIKSKFGEQIIFPGGEPKNDVLVFLPDAQITKDSMMTLVREALGRMPKKENLPKVEVKKVISIEEMIDKLTERIKETMQMNFHDFSGVGRKPKTKEEKVVVIVSFLAMLELVRQGILNAVQEEGTSDILIQKQIEQNEQHESVQ